MKYKHFIWDFDGTLFNSYPIMASSFSDMLHEIGVSEPAAAIMPFMKVSMGHAKKHYKEKYDLADSFFERYDLFRKQAEKEELQPFCGIAELLKAICDNKGRNYLFTHRGESALYFIEKFGLTPFFHDTVTSRQNFSRKPSPDAILSLMATHDFCADEALMVGDRELDILSGKNANTHTCFFSEGGELCDIADINIKSFSNLYKYIDISPL